jgi:hypothetical protein
MVWTSPDFECSGFLVAADSTCYLGSNVHNGKAEPRSWRGRPDIF